MTTRHLIGCALSQLPTLDARIAQTCVTSPPYWGLRDYGVEGQIGLERTPGEYIEKIVAVFREVRRVLKDDGTLWLNMGDCYATGAGSVGEHPGGGERGAKWAGRGHRGVHLPNEPAHMGKHFSRKGSNRAQRGDGNEGVAYGPMTQPNRMPIEGLKPKDLVGMPWRVAFALQADGWWLRSDIIWSKPSPMPESVTDRPTKAHEYLFLLAKAERYYYDAAAIAEPALRAGEAKWDPGTNGLGGEDRKTGKSTRRFGSSGNKERKQRQDHGGPADNPSHQAFGVPWEGVTRNKRTVWTVPSKPFAQAHFATFPPKLIEPCILAGSRRGDIVLDPFGGAGTTGLVASRLGRDSILVELNPAYAAMSSERIRADAPLLADA